MAGVVRKSLLSSAKLISRQLLSSKHACAQRITVPLTCRSYWNINSISPVRALVSSKVPQTQHTCGPCCRLHTEVDKEVSKFLEKEIENEESSVKSTAGLPKIQGFDVSADDSQVTLTRKQGNESLKVIFNVNGSADSDQVRPAGEESSQEVQMISRPPFTVELDKGTGETLSFQCVFSSVDEYEQEGGSSQDAEPIVDQFDIVEVALHKGKWTETVYSLQSETMDGNLYELLMDMLDERGINDDFVNDLVEFSTAYEHGKYVGMLKALKSFVEKN